MKFILNENKHEDAFKDWVINNNGNEEYADKYLNKYRKILSSPYNDIYYWVNGKGDYSEFKSIIEDKLNTEQAKAEKKSAIEKGITRLYEDDTWLVIEIKDPIAARKYGKHTKWCISGDTYDSEKDFYKYRSNGYRIFFYINKKTNHKWAYSANDNYQYKLAQYDDELNMPANAIPGKPAVPEIDNLDVQLAVYNLVYEDNVWKVYEVDHDAFPGVQVVKNKNSTEEYPIVIDRRTGKAVGTQTGSREQLNMREFANLNENTYNLCVNWYCPNYGVEL